MTREDAKSMRLFTQWQDEQEFLDIEASVVTKDHEMIIDRIYDALEELIIKSIANGYDCGNCNNNHLGYDSYTCVNCQEFYFKNWEKQDD